MGRWAILNVVLGVLVMLLGIQIVRTWSRTLPPVDMTPRPVDAAPKAERRDREKGRRGAAAQPASPGQLVAGIVARDLFDPSRQKPSEEAKPVEAVVVPPPSGITVVGVRIFGKDREAFIQDASQQNKQRRVRTGDEVAGHTVKLIEKKRVVLGAPTGETVELTLQVEKKGGAAPGAKAGPRPANPGGSPAAGLAAKPPPAQGVVLTTLPPPAKGPAGAPGAAPQPALRNDMPRQLRQKLEKLQRERQEG